jgi:very-short-patch-repair endonuclease
MRIGLPLEPEGTVHERHPEQRLGPVAARQHGVFTTGQALFAGFSMGTIKRNVATGRWRRLHRGVLVASTVAVRWPQRVTAAWLACGDRSVLSFQSARTIWGLADEVQVPDVTVARGRQRAHAGVRVHQSRRLDAVTHLGYRVTSPMRTLLDLASCERADLLARDLDEAHRRRLIDFERFDDYLAQPFAIAKPGSGALREMVRARDPLHAPETDAETLLFEALRIGRLPLPQTQVWVTTRRRRCRIDFAYPDERIAIEVDSWKDHGTRPAFEADRARQNELVELGWRVLRFTWLQLTTEPVEVMVSVGIALGLVPARWTHTRRVGRAIS